MTLVSCVECKNLVAKKAPYCPKCGEPDPSRQRQKSSILTRLFGLFIALIAASYLWFAVIPDMRTQFLASPTTQRQAGLRSVEVIFPSLSTCINIYNYYRQYQKTSVADDISGCKIYIVKTTFYELSLCRFNLNIIYIATFNINAKVSY